VRLSRDNNRRVSCLESSTNNELLNIIEEKSISEQVSLVSAADLLIPLKWCERIFGSELLGGYLVRTFDEIMSQKICCRQTAHPGERRSHPPVALFWHHS
jgi:hypothetical protein